MPDENLLVIAVDGLRASAVGAYGNTSYATPSLDALAAESFLLDNCFAAATDLEAIYRSLWTAAHPLRSESSATPPAPLPVLLAGQGHATALVTDDPVVAALPGAVGFDQCVSIAGAAPTRAVELAGTSFARLFAAACEHLAAEAGGSGTAAGHRPRCVWVHSRGMYGPWDAPLALQEPLLAREEGDPSPCEAVEPPNVVLGEDDDPDATFRWSCGYAAQVIALDACLAGLLEWLLDTPAREPWTVVLLGIRGFPLGEHDRVGGVDGRLFAEQLHVPLLWRLADRAGQLARSGVLASHVDVVPTLLDRFGRFENSSGGTPDGLSLLPLIIRPGEPWRDALVAAGAGPRSLRTAEWSLRCEPLTSLAGAATGPISISEADRWRRELYVRPDDRWEANDVARLCPNEVASLASVLDEATHALLRCQPLRRRMPSDET